jgi:hypothetical protein
VITVVSVAVVCVVINIMIVIKVSNKTPKLYTYLRSSPAQFSAKNLVHGTHNARHRKLLRGP